MGDKRQQHEVVPDRIIRDDVVHDGHHIHGNRRGKDNFLKPQNNFMIAQTIATTTSSYRTAGRAAIISGILGLMAYGFLLTAVLSRDSWVVSGFAFAMFKAHDVGVILQFLFMVPVIYGLQKLSQKHSAGMSQTTLRVGIGALLFTVLFLFLGLIKIFSDGHYSVPLGVFGAWMIAVNWRLHGVIPVVLRWFGMIVGLGLVAFGSFFPAFAIFVDDVILRIPAVDLSTYPEPPMNFANMVLHKLIWVGGVMGVAPFPVWTLWVGRRLLREDKGIQSTHQTTIL
jgi:hypothetical protein